MKFDLVGTSLMLISVQERQESIHRLGEGICVHKEEEEEESLYIYR